MTGSYIPQTLITLCGKNRSYTFDLSGQFPDFKNRKEILVLIEQHMPVKEKTLTLKEAKRKQNRIGIVVLMTLLGLFWLFHFLGFW